MTQLVKYQYATWILALAVIILGILLIRASKPDASSALEQASDALAKCNTDIADWRAKYPAGTPATEASQSELANILQNCSGNIQ